MLGGLTQARREENSKAFVLSSCNAPSSTPPPESCGRRGRETGTRNSESDLWRRDAATVKGILVSRIARSFAGSRKNRNLGRHERSSRVSSRADSALATRGVLWFAEEGNVRRHARSRRMHSNRSAPPAPRSRTRPSLGPEAHALHQGVAHPSPIGAGSEGGCGPRPREDFESSAVRARTSYSLQKSSGDAWPQISSRAGLQKGASTRVNGGLARRNPKASLSHSVSATRKGDREFEPRRGNEARSRGRPRMA